MRTALEILCLATATALSVAWFFTILQNWNPDCGCCAGLMQ